LVVQGLDFNHSGPGQTLLQGGVLLHQSVGLLVIQEELIKEVVQTPSVVPLPERFLFQQTVDLLLTQGIAEGADVIGTTGGDLLVNHFLVQEFTALEGRLGGILVNPQRLQGAVVENGLPLLVGQQADGVPKVTSLTQVVEDVRKVLGHSPGFLVIR